MIFFSNNKTTVQSLHFPVYLKSLKKLFHTTSLNSWIYMTFCMINSLDSRRVSRGGPRGLGPPPLEIEKQKKKKKKKKVHQSKY